MEKKNKKKVAESTRLGETSEMTESEPWQSSPCQLEQALSATASLCFTPPRIVTLDTHCNV